MATGLYSGVSGLAIGVGLNKGVTGLWSGASGLITGWGATAFNPLSLFAAGEPGAWYDPSDLSTMFQDTAGTTPVTATGQTVALVLDKSQGLVLGPELVTNGDFSSGFGTGWTDASSGTGSASIAGGQASVTSNTSANPGYIVQAITTVIGRSYLLTWQVVSGANAQVRVGISSTGTQNAQIINASIVSSAVFVATATTTFVTLANNNSITTSAYDNISVKELAGNHATQATAASRPIYGIEPFGGRRNLLTYTEQFDNAAWAKINVTATASVLTETTATGFHNVQGNYSNDGASKTWAVSVEVKANGRDFAWIDEGSVAGAVFTVNLTNGSVNLLGAAWTSVTVTAVGDGWYRVVGIMTRATSLFRYKVGPALDASTLSYVGDASKGIQVRNAQLEISSTATAYQRVTDQWNVTQAGVPSVSYIQCDGTDDFMLTGTITPGTDKAQVFAGVRKLSDVFVVIAETSIITNNNNGALLLYTNSGGRWGYLSKGTVSSFVEPSGYPVPSTNVLTGVSDIAGDVATLRVNGTQVATSAADQGTGNYLAYPLYIGRRGGTSAPFNGRIYQMLVRFGANLSAATITQTENYTAGKTGIYTVEQLIRLNTLNASGTSFLAYAAADSSGNNYPVTNTVLAANGTPYSVL